MIRSTVVILLKEPIVESEILELVLTTIANGW
jgi:hypothetical protein